jgi:hypothetical protein
MMELTAEERGMVELQWKSLQAELKSRFEKIPDLNAVLMLIGIQEVGDLRDKYSKEQKQDLMHVAVCTLLGQEGYYEFHGLDHEGWPHFRSTKYLPSLSVEDQEVLLKKNVIRYFEEEGNLA